MNINAATAPRRSNSRRTESSPSRPGRRRERHLIGGLLAGATKG
jgi:hypothetical protein